MSSLNLKDVQRYAEKIFYYRGAVDRPSEIVSLLESTNSVLTSSDAILPWKKWTASDNDGYTFGEQKQVDARRLNTSSDSVITIYKSLTNALDITGRHYCVENDLEYFTPSPLSISKYNLGASMGSHVDVYPGQITVPIMSGVLYLNDTYEGGELEFPVQGVSIKPEQGSIVIFPSVEPFSHQSLEIISGVKYMSPVFWVR
jgi:hypothetical protein